MAQSDQQQPEKMGLLARLRRNRRSTPRKAPRKKRRNDSTPSPPQSQQQQQEQQQPASKPDQRESSASPPPTETHRESPVVSEQQQRMVVSPEQSNNPNTMKIRKRSKLPWREEVALAQAPSAQEAAFGGPPRYDWIDIETAAAIKVQAAYRRNRAMMELEAQGLSTSAIRNRSRRRKARGMGGDPNAANEDLPSLFRCCGVGLAFGDGNDEDYEDVRQREREQYTERKKAREIHEARLRSQYRRKNYQQQSQGDEAFEVLE